MAGGNFTANLNSNGLKLNVKNYKLKNNNINLDLYDAASSYENIDYTTSEENINTNLNTNDFDFGESISKASNQLQEIKSTQEEEKPWWDVVFDYAATAVGSVVSGVVDVVENIGDGLIMCGGELASGVASLCGNEDLASEIKKGTQDIVQYDWSEAAYDAAMDALDVDDEIAHGVVHQVGNAVGSMAGYAALSLVPGGAAVTAATGFLAAKGSSAEHAFQSGATFEEASVTSTVAGAAGALSGAALNKVQGAAKGASSIKNTAKLTEKGMAVSVAEPVVNSVTEYTTYGKNMTDEKGNPLYDNFGDYYLKSGGVLNTVAGGLSTGSYAIKKYKNGYSKSMMFNEDLEVSLTGHTTEVKIDKGRKSIQEDFKIDLNKTLDQKLNESIVAGDELEKNFYKFFSKYNYDNAEFTGIGTTGLGLRPEDIPSEILERLIPDQNAVFGYRSNGAKSGQWAGLDFGDAEKTMKNRRLREGYLARDSALKIEIERLLKLGASKEDVARFSIDYRNSSKIEWRASMTPEALFGIEVRNMLTYSDTEIFISEGLTKDSKNVKLLSDKIKKQVQQIIENRGNTNLTIEQMHEMSLDVASELLGLNSSDGRAAAIGPSLEFLIEKNRSKLKQEGISSPTMDQILDSIIDSSSKGNEELNILLGIKQ